MQTVKFAKGQIIQSVCWLDGKFTFLLNPVRHRRTPIRYEVTTHTGEVLMTLSYNRNSDHYPEHFHLNKESGKVLLRIGRDLWDVRTGKLEYTVPTCPPEERGTYYYGNSTEPKPTPKQKQEYLAKYSVHHWLENNGYFRPDHDECTDIPALTDRWVLAAGGYDTSLTLDILLGPTKRKEMVKDIPVQKGKHLLISDRTDHKFFELQISPEIICLSSEEHMVCLCENETAVIIDLE